MTSLTPFARRQMTPELAETIAAAEPRDYIVALVKGTSGWTCRILSPRRVGVVAEAYGEPSPMVAFMTAYARVKE